MIRDGLSASLSAISIYPSVAHLSCVDLSRFLVVVQLEDGLALRRGVHLQHLAELRVVQHAALVLVRGLEALVGLLDRLRLEIVLLRELLQSRLLGVTRLRNRKREREREI
jgi:hypothetical protein